jgi:hypothetical protein
MFRLELLLDAIVSTREHNEALAQIEQTLTRRRRLFAYAVAVVLMVVAITPM